jgi:signal transduction histidine kinase
MPFSVNEPSGVETWFDGLVKISRRIASMEDVDAAFVEIVAITRELMYADTASLALLEAADKLVLKYQATRQTGSQPQNAPVDAPLLWSAVRSAAAHRVPEDIQQLPLHWNCNGELHTVQVAAIAPLYLDTVPIGILWVGRYDATPFSASDMSRLGHLADQAVIALEHASMAARLQSLAVIEERSRIAREMHDSLAQILGYLGLEMQTLERLLRQGDTDAVLAELKQAQRTIKSAQVDVRSNILSLRTTLSGEVGLVASLQNYVNEFAIQTNLTARLIDTTGIEITLSPLAETQFVRIVQEAMTNVRKHAQASTVELRLRTQGQNLEVTIADDGVGMGEQEAAQSHFGLQTMRERAESIGGSLSIASVPGSGTTVYLVLPLV